MKYGLEIYAPVGPAGHFFDTVELFGGQRVFDANPNVVEALKERGKLWHRESFSHQYPHCWRCHNPVIFLATSQWFIDLDTVRLKPDATAVERGDTGADGGSAHLQADRDRSRVRLQPDRDRGSVRLQADRDCGTVRLQPDRSAEGKTLRQAALDAIDHDVHWVPAWGHDRMYNMVA